MSGVNRLILVRGWRMFAQMLGLEAGVARKLFSSQELSHK